MRKPTSFFVLTMSIYLFLSLIFASCGRNTLDSPTGTHPSLARKAVNQVYALAWSPNGTKLATGGKNGVIQVWNTTIHTLLATAETHAGEMYALAWSPDGKYLATGSWDGTVQVWEALTGKLLRTYHGHTAEVWNVSWSPKGKLIASVGEGGVVQIWNAITGTPVWLLRL
jgi:WD40 repeat protein